MKHYKLHNFHVSQQFPVKRKKTTEIPDYEVSCRSILLFYSENESVSYLKYSFTRCVKNLHLLF